MASADRSSSFTICEQALRHDRQIGIHAISKDGLEVGTLEGDLDHTGTVLRDVYFFVHTNWRGQSLSRRLTKKLFAQFPRINEIYAVLIYDNLEAFLKARQLGQSREESIRQTPFYKVFEAHGFTEVEFRSPVEGEKDADLLVTIRKRK